MTYKILLTTAGGGNAINVVRSLKEAFPDIYIVGTNINKFELAKSNADKNYIVPRYDSEEYCKSILKIIENEKIDFMIPNHEFEIEAIHKHKNERILEKCFMPDIFAVMLCNNKFSLVSYLDKNGFSNHVAKSVMLNSYADLYKQYDYPVWIRLVRGAGSQGATLIYNHQDLMYWVEYWMEHKKVDIQEFMVSEYLPGDDHHYFSLWKDGEMLIGKAIQRLQYCCAKYTLTGTSSSPSLCTLVANPELDALAEGMIKSISPNANGLFGIDFKQNSKGQHCLTEINAGRFPRINYIFNLAEEPNIAEYYVYCGLDKLFDKPKKTVTEGEQWYLFRDFDLGLTLKHITEIEVYEKI